MDKDEAIEIYNNYRKSNTGKRPTCCICGKVIENHDLHVTLEKSRKPNFVHRKCVYRGRKK